MKALFSLLIIVFLAILVTPARIFLDPGNLTDILRQVSVTGIIALAMTFVILTAGVVIDEAYIHFSHHAQMSSDLVANVVVLRTFSKIYGMAASALASRWGERTCSQSFVLMERACLRCWA